VFSLCLTKVQFYYDIPIDFSQFFHVKPTLRWILDMPEFWIPFFSGQSLLLSTTVLNDEK